MSDAKLCPLLAMGKLAASHMAEDGDAPPGNYHSAHCRREACAWWDDEHGDCAVYAIPRCLQVHSENLHEIDRTLVEILKERVQ